MGELLDRTKLIIRTKLHSRRERSAFKPTRDQIGQVGKTVADLNRAGALSDHAAAGLQDVLDDMTVKAPGVDVDALNAIGSERIGFAKKVIASTDRPGILDPDHLAGLEYAADVSRRAETQIKPEAQPQVDSRGAVSRRALILGLALMLLLDFVY